MKEYLCLSLTGKASEFYALVTDKRDNLSFVNIVEKLVLRFGYKELPETAKIKFSNATQTHDETIDDWADRFLTLATKAFRHLPANYMNEQVVLCFCHGLNDKEAGESVVNMRPKSIEEAINGLCILMVLCLVDLNLFPKTLLRNVSRSNLLEMKITKNPN
ncbi:hypothetical protein DPMN_065340 [Dreissena polymorpha]|uniref:Retrotransposon gag domain-containing protein n=1 Tax=Dreissena polymorpha TaxID=45954 RepID=A0A9D4CDW1_DREPO|nr:hypothetical protein DPMN_065340 [Dreissena polymorpha]